MIKVGFISLGCPKNQVDSEYMIGNIKNQSGFEIVNNLHEAQVIIINTCSFINDAKEESIETIIEAGKYKEQAQCEAIIITGCLPQRYAKELTEQMPEIDGILGTGNLDEIIDIVDEVLTGQNVNRVKEPGFNYRSDLPRQLTDNHYAYVKIAEGCNNNCSYCVIPSLRGPVNSREIEDIYQEVVNLAQKGVKEIILVAQDTTQYGIDIYDKPALASLLRKIVTIKGIKWIRLMYSYPERIKNNLIQIIKDNNKICNYLDLPVQHSSNKIRNAMKRKGNRKQLTSIIRNIRKNIPDISIRTSLIVGFPGETQKDFQDLYNFVKETRFDRLGVFKYSQEEGTAAAKFSDQINEDIKQQRYQKIMELQQQISREKNQQLINREFEVLIDEVDKEYAIARSQYDAPEIDNQIFIYNKNLYVGEFIKCKIIDAYEYDLTGERIDEFTQ